MEFDASLAEEFGRSRVSEVSESSGRLPPRAKYWLPRDGIVAASVLRLLYVHGGGVCVWVCVGVGGGGREDKIR